MIEQERRYRSRYSIRRAEVVIAIVFCIFLLYSCKDNSMASEYLELYVKSKEIDYKRKEQEGLVEYYKGKDSTSCIVFYDKHGDIIEIRNVVNGKKFGDLLLFANNSISEYYFMSNDTNTTSEVRFGSNNTIVHELGSPIVYNELSGNTTNDSVQVNIVLNKAIFKELSLKCSIDGENYDDYQLVQSDNPKFINNYLVRYTFPLPPKNIYDIDPYVCMYRIIEGVTIFGEKKVYNDTLCTYINNKYLK